MLGPVLAGSRVRGALVHAHLEWVRDCFGESVAARVIGALLARVAREVAATPPDGWCSFESLIQLDRTIAQVCGLGRDGIYRELGHHTARADAISRGGTFARTDIHRYLRCSAVRDTHFLDRAVCRYDEVSPTGGRLAILEAGSSSAVYCASLAGYYQQVITLHGAEAVEVTESAC